MDLKKKLNQEINLLIIEVDCAHQKALDYYKKKYNVKDDFIENYTMLINKKIFKLC